MKLGRLTPLDYSTLIDRYNLNTLIPQKYNSFEGLHPYDFDNSKVNLLRKEIGLYSLDYMKWRLQNVSF